MFNEQKTFNKPFINCQISQILHPRDIDVRMDCILSYALLNQRMKTYVSSWQLGVSNDLIFFYDFLQLSQFLLLSSIYIFNDWALVLISNLTFPYPHHTR